MVRSNWIGTVWGVLAWTGLALGQTSAPAPTATPRERFLTLQEQDRPGQRCKLLKAWRTPDGSRAYLVQVVQTAELITVVESAPADPKGKSAAMKIYHWGS